MITKAEYMEMVKKLMEIGREMYEFYEEKSPIQDDFFEEVGTMTEHCDICYSILSKL